MMHHADNTMVIVSQFTYFGYALKAQHVLQN